MFRMSRIHIRSRSFAWEEYGETCITAKSMNRAVRRGKFVWIRLEQTKLCIARAVALYPRRGRSAESMQFTMEREKWRRGKRAGGGLQAELSARNNMRARACRGECARVKYDGNVLFVHGEHVYVWVARTKKIRVKNIKKYIIALF